MTKEITLRGGSTVTVDDEDHDNLTQWKWSLSDTGYAVRYKKRPERGAIYMHRQMMNPCADQQVDHINCKKLDNTRKNLRLCSISQNTKNKGLRSGKTHKGVYKFDKNKWVARIGHNYKVVHLGLFDCKIEAAKAYNAAAIKYHGEFAHLNLV